MLQFLSQLTGGLALRIMFRTRTQAVPPSSARSPWFSFGSVKPSPSSSEGGISVKKDTNTRTVLPGAKPDKEHYANA